VKPECQLLQPKGDDGACARSNGCTTLKVYNTLGEEVATLTAGNYSAGTFRTTWDLSGLPGGLYLYRLTAGGYVQTKKAVLMK